MARRKPYSRCAVCNRTLEETGGKRLVSTHTFSVSVCNPQTPIGNLRHPARTIRLDGVFRDVIVAMFGPRLWTDESVTHIREAIQEGFRPWFCQRCAERDLCPTCGSPMTTVPGANHMEDDGRVWHQPYFMGMGNAYRCTNGSCPSD